MITDGTLKQLQLTTRETAYLKSFLDAGDRPGFYMAYYSMVGADHGSGDSDVGKDEASLQAKISSFSESVGAAAYYANRFLKQYAAGYSGIYNLSQAVAVAAYDGLVRNDRRFETDLQLFDTAVAAWRQNELQAQFPGLLLDGHTLPSTISRSTGHTVSFFWWASRFVVTEGRRPTGQEIFTWLQGEAGDRVGEWVAALAGVYVLLNGGGKQVDSASGATVLTTADGEQRFAVDAGGHVYAVHLDSINGTGASKYETLDGFTKDGVLGLLTIGSVIVGPALTILGAGTVTALAELLFEPLFGAYTPSDWLALNSPEGDANASHPPSSQPIYAFASAATGGDETLLGTTGADIMSGLGGDDVLFAGGGNDELFGGSGDDILWGEDGTDVLHGGTGDDVLRGGDGDDTLHPDGGDDFIAGGTGTDTIDMGYEGATTPADLTVEVRKDGGNEQAYIRISTAADTIKAVEVERLTLTEESDIVRLGYLGQFVSQLGNPTADNPMADFKIDFGGTAAPARDDDKIDVSGTPLTATWNGVTTNHVGVRVDLSDSENQTVQYLAKWGSGIVQRSAVLATFANANSVIGTDENDELIGESGRKPASAGSASRSSGGPANVEGYSSLDGGKGDDVLLARGWASRLTGGLGEDVFFVGANTVVTDAEAGLDEGPGTRGDVVSWAGIQLYGGVSPFWSETGVAAWAPFTSLITVMPVIGSQIFAAAAFLIDKVTMKFASYKSSGSDLIMNFGWGQIDAGIIENYHLDFDTGLGSGNIAAFTLSRSEKHGGSLTSIEKAIGLALKAGFGVMLGGGFDPLVLDLDGDGIELRTEENSSVYFEFDTDGFGEHTGWLRGDDGFLVLDANANGKIDSVAEMFGNRTTPGFTALGAYDSNSDGKIDASDTVFASLRVWQDLNQDGVTDSGELKSLTDLGIVSISLTNAAPATPTTIGGNQIVREGQFTRTDGSTGKASDVALRLNETDTKYLGDATVSSAAAALPELAGFGEVRNLSVAMTQDSSLLTMVSAFTANTTNDLSALKSGAEQILYRWAQVDGITATALGSNGFDTRKLAFLEKFSGYQLMPRNSGGVIQLDNIGELESMWSEEVTRLTLRLVVQGPLASDFSTLHYDLERDLAIANGPTALADLLHTRLAALPTGATAALADWTAWAPLLGALSDGMVRADGNIVHSDYLFTQLVRAMDGLTLPLSLTDLAVGLGIPATHIGTAGADTLTHDAVADTTVFYGAGGDDTFTGGGGQDVYVFGRSIGHATITDIENSPSGDRIRFAFLDQSDVHFARDGNDLLITVIATLETVRVTGQFAPVVPLGSDVLLSTDKGVEDIQFADGSIMEIPEIMTAIGSGSDGDDHMIGTMHSDVLMGGLGDDLLEGGDDADLYVVRADEGNDVIHDVQSTPLLRAADLLVFGEGLAPQDLTLVRDGDNLLVNTGGGNSVLIEGQFGYTSLGFNDKFAPNNRIEAFAFKTYAESWSNKDVQQMLIAEATSAGNDTTEGFGDDDDFASSAGNDLLIGHDGQDSYHWGRGSGNDTIDEQSRYIDINVGLGGLMLGVAADVVYFSDDITAGDITFSRSTSAPDLTITLNSTGETLTIKNQFAGYQTGVLGAQWMDRIEWFAFADGSAFSWQDVLAKITTGGAGDDTLTGDLYADTLEGKGGNDFLSGKGYGDLYKFGLGDGQDVIQDANQFALGEGFITVDTQPDTLLLGAGINPGDIRFEHTGKDIKLIVGTGGNSVLLKNQDDYLQTEVLGAISWDRIEQIKFADGTTWGWEELNQRVIAAGTTSGNDHTYGFTFDDTFAASAGDDILEGGDGNDTYAFGRGSGHDEVRESLSNVLNGDDDAVQFAVGVLPADIALTRDGDDLVVTITDTGDTLRIKGEFDNYIDYTWTDIERFVFANGTTWTKADVQNKLMQPTSGNDVITGFHTNDTLTGGAGIDTLRGRDGSDTYLFNLGDGQDRIEESVEFANIEDNDRVVFGAGIAPGDIVVSRNGNDVILSVSGTNDSLTITGEFDQQAWFTWSDVETFEFANGTVWTKDDVAAKLLAGTSGDDTINGTSANDRLEGGLGNDQLYGGDGSDTYVFAPGDGQDVINETVNNAYINDEDRLVFKAGIAPADLIYTRDGENLVITFAGSTDSIRIAGEFNYYAAYSRNDIERFEFADGTMLTKEQIQQKLLTGTSGNDHLVGFGSNDILDGGPGDDILEGKDADDTYRFGRGDGHDIVRESLYSGASSENDTLEFKAGILSTDVTVNRVGNDAVFTLDTGETITVEGQFVEGYNEFLSNNDVEQVRFADGTVWTKANIAERSLHPTAGNDVLEGTRLDETIDGLGGDDILRGNGGNDILRGGTGDDRLEGSWGNDTYVYNLGDGADVIYDYNYGNDEADRLAFGPGITAANLVFANNPSDSSEMRISFNNGPGSVTVINQWYGDAGIEFIDFADGTTWTLSDLRTAFVAGQSTSGADLIYGTGDADTINGGAGNDNIWTYGGNDTLTGGVGNDQLQGGAGDDVYNYAIGDGLDVIDDYDYWGNGSNTVAFGAGIAASDILVSRIQGSSADIRITFKAADGAITVRGQDYWNAGIDLLTFAGGGSLTSAQLTAMLLPTTDGADTYSGTSGADDIWGLEGDDHLSGMGGADQIHGGDGADVIHGDSAVALIATGSNLLTNGSFEASGTVTGGGSWGIGNSDLPGWTKANSQPFEQVYSGVAGVTASDGSLWLDMDSGGGSGSNMDISQTVTGLTAGQDMLLTFDHSNRTGGASGSFEVFWNGVSVGTYLDTNATMVTATLALTAVAGNNVVRFRGLGSEDSDGAALDNVRLNAATAVSAGADEIWGGAGNDTIYGDGGDDVIHGDSGADLLIGDAGNDTIDGGDGDDTIYGDSAGSYLPTGANLVVNGSFETSGTVTNWGWWGVVNSDLPGWTKSNSQGYEQIYSGVVGVSSTDGSFWLDMDASPGSGANLDISQTLTGMTAGQVLLLSFDHSNRLGNSSGSFEVRWNGNLAGTYNDANATMVTTTMSLTALAGSNVIEFKALGAEDGDGASLDNVRIFATTGGSGGNDVLSGGAGNDSVYGGAGEDLIDGGQGNDQLFGEDGADRLTGGAGDDSLNGGNGNDVAVFAGAKTSHSLVTSGGTTTIVDNAPTVDGDDGTDTLVGIEKAEFAGGEQVGIAAPIIIDLDGDGVQATGLDQSATRFDWDGDGVADRTAWVGGGDAFLMLDRNGDGTVSGASELSFTGDKPGAKSDLDGLTAFDSDHDGALSANDARWSSFHLWADGNANGVVDEGEYRTLAEAGITSISLGGQSVDRAWSWSEVVTVNTGTVGLAGGSSTSFGDVALTYEVGQSIPIATPLVGNGQGFASGSWTEKMVGDERFEDIGLIVGEPGFRSLARAARLAQSMAAFTPLSAAGDERHGMVYSVEREGDRLVSTGFAGGRGMPNSEVHLL